MSESVGMLLLVIGVFLAVTFGTPHTVALILLMWFTGRPALIRELFEDGERPFYKKWEFYLVVALAILLVYFGYSAYLAQSGGGNWDLFFQFKLSAKG